MTYSKIPVAQSIVALCLSKQITHVVISPGSRNAPLTIGFSEHDEIHSYSIVDERCAAFVALGMAQKLEQPVALVCTSGSALLNYYPAIAEAFYSDIPLVIISADRPIERIDIGDGQTIRQKDVFKNHILYSANLYSEAVPLQEPTDPKIKQKLWESQRHNEQEINKALNLAITQKGPVHINVPFYEPLYETVTKMTVKPLEILPEVKVKKPKPNGLSTFINQWQQANRKLVIVGVQAPNQVKQAYLDILAEDDSVIVMTETTSNLHHPNFFASIDTIIAPIETQDNATELFKALQPDILLTFGGMVVSKKIKAFLRTYQPKHHWHVDPKKAFDTYFCLEKHFKFQSDDFFEVFLNDYKAKESAYFPYWDTIKNQRQLAQEAYEKSIVFSDFKVFQHILEGLPEHSNLHLSNSSTVRYAQLFNIHDSIPVYCNRGTSGIDGSSSTAIGFAIAAEQQTVLVTGDLGFFYDSNALWNTYIPKSFRILLINNNGGGIFRILPGTPSSANFERYFETTHSLDASKLCEMHGFGYSKVTSEKELQEKLISFFQGTANQPKLLEIQTPRTVNDDVLMAYFKALKS